MIGPRLLASVNGLAALACVLHVAVHAIGLDVGAWHDYVLYALVLAGFVVSLAHLRQVRREEPVTA